MKPACMKGFGKDIAGAATIEYVVLLLPLIALVFTSFQIALAYHFALSAQKAVELGARIAAVRDPVHTALPVVNEENPLAPRDGRSAFIAGDSCALDACAAPAGGPWSCSGADLDSPDCDAAAFQEIFAEVSRIAYFLEPSDLTVTYSYARLGFVGGPFIPIIEVTIEERPFFLQLFFNLAFGSGDDASQQVRLPAVAASAVAEDLSSRN